MRRKAAVCPDNTGMVLGQETHTLMDHQTLTKMCNYLRSSHYAIPLLDNTNFSVSHTSFFPEVLRGVLVLVAQGQCLKVGTVTNKNTE